jgi:hypothetical protein
MDVTRHYTYFTFSWFNDTRAVWPNQPSFRLPVQSSLHTYLKFVDIISKSLPEEQRKNKNKPKIQASNQIHLDPKSNHESVYLPHLIYPETINKTNNKIV